MFEIQFFAHGEWHTYLAYDHIINALYNILNIRADHTERKWRLVNCNGDRLA